MQTNRKKTPQMEIDPITFYVDGTIGSIEIATGADGIIQFSLLPLPEFLKTVTETKNGEIEIRKKALFIKSGKPDFAHLRDVAKNENGKDIVLFSITTQNAALIRYLLLEAKNNRNIVRVFVGSTGGFFDADFSKATDLQIR